MRYSYQLDSGRRIGIGLERSSLLCRCSGRSHATLLLGDEERCVTSARAAAKETRKLKVYLL